MNSNSLWGSRVPISIDGQIGMITAGSASRPINLSGDISLALSSYLSMIYELRNLSTGVIPLRKEDIVVLADAFEMEDSDVAEQLARLMHCDDLQTARFVQMVRKGRVLVPVSMVAAGALLAASLSFVNPQEAHSTVKPEKQQTVKPASVFPTDPASVDLGDGVQVQRVDNSQSVISPLTTYVVDSDGKISAPNETSENPLPDPGEVFIGDAATVSREDPAL